MCCFFCFVLLKQVQHVLYAELLSCNRQKQKKRIPDGQAGVSLTTDLVDMYGYRLLSMLSRKDYSQMTEAGSRVPYGLYILYIACQDPE